MPIHERGPKRLGCEEAAPTPPPRPPKRRVGKALGGSAPWPAPGGETKVAASEASPDLKANDNEPAAVGAGEHGIGALLGPAGSGKGGSWAAAGARDQGSVDGKLRTTPEIAVLFSCAGAQILNFRRARGFPQPRMFRLWKHTEITMFFPFIWDDVRLIHP